MMRHTNDLRKGVHEKLRPSTPEASPDLDQIDSRMPIPQGVVRLALLYGHELITRKLIRLRNLLDLRLIA